MCRPCATGQKLRREEMKIGTPSDTEEFRGRV